MVPRWTAVLLVASVAAACARSSSDPTDEWSRRPGVIDPAMSSVQLAVVPAHIYRGEPFEVVVHTLGSSSCTRVDGMEVLAGGVTMDLTPYDLYAPPGQACTDDLHAFEHRATLTFESLGEGKLRIHGRDWQGRALTFDIHIQVRAR